MSGHREEYAPPLGVDKPFSVKKRRQMSRQYGYGHRPTNDWGSGDLPAPWAEGDLVFLPEDVDNDRLRGMGWGFFVVANVFSIDEGDAWYCRVTNNLRWASDRLHIAWSERCSWDEDVDWMAGFELVESADPEGLAKRKELLAAGWTPTYSPGHVEEMLLHWFLDNASVCVNDEHPAPVTVSFGTDWLEVPEHLHEPVRRYATGAHRGEGATS